MTAKGQRSVEAVPDTNTDLILAGFPAHRSAALLQSSRQFHGCSQVSSQTTAAQLLLFFSPLTSYNSGSPRFPSIMFRGSGRVPCHSEKSPVMASQLQTSVGIITAWANVIQQSSPHVSKTAITRATSHYRVLRSNCCCSTKRGCNCSALVLQ